MGSPDIKYEHYLPVVLAAVVVWLLGVWNPKFIREDKAKRVEGSPSPMWLSLFALVVGCIVVWFYNH